MRKRQRCEATGKRRYRDHREVVKALQGAKRSREEGNPHARAIRGYSCGVCKGWHLTSQIDMSALIDPVSVMQVAS